MGFTPFASLAAQLAGATIPGALTVGGLLTTQAGITNSGAGVTLTATNLTTTGLGTITASGGYNAGVGSIDVPSAGQGLKIAEGSNARQGRPAALTAGTVTVANTAVTAASEIWLTGQIPGGTPGGLNVSARTAGTSFTITSTNAADTSTAAFLMNEPG